MSMYQIQPMQADNITYMPEMAQLAAKFVRAYLECTLQKAVRDMIDILNSPESDKDECEMALHTLMELLFPQRLDVF